MYEHNNQPTNQPTSNEPATAVGFFETIGRIYDTVTTWRDENPIPCATFGPSSCANAIMWERLRQDGPALLKAIPVLTQIATDKASDIIVKTDADYEEYGVSTAADTLVVESADALTTAASVMATGFVDSLATNWNTYSHNLMATEYAVTGDLSSGDLAGAYLATQRGVLDVGVPAQRFGEQTVGTLAAAWGVASAGATVIDVGYQVLRTPMTLTPAFVTVGGRTMVGAGTFVGEAEGLAGSLGTTGAGVMAMAGSSPLGYSPTYKGSDSTGGWLQFDRCESYQLRCERPVKITKGSTITWSRKTLVFNREGKPIGSIIETQDDAGRLVAIEYQQGRGGYNYKSIKISRDPESGALTAESRYFGRSRDATQLEIADGQVVVPNDFNWQGPPISIPPL